MRKRIQIRIRHGVLLLVLSVLLGGCRKADSALLLATQQEEGQETVSSGGESSLADEDVLSSEESASAQEDTSAEEEGLYIYICGEVTNPGVYILGAHARLCDAVEAAGGMTESASRTYWNLAMELTDGQMIYIPTMEEAAERDFSPLSADNAAGTGSTSGADESYSTGSAAGISADGKVDINKATKEQLMTIPGIGETKANSILTYREENGDYAAVEDIMKVSGIKEGLFQSIKEYITVD